MRKATATVLYNRDTMQIYNLTVNYKGSFVQVLKNNNYYTGVYKEFGAAWYDIGFININNPVHVDKMSYKEVA